MVPREQVRRSSPEQRRDPEPEPPADAPSEQRDPAGLLLSLQRGAGNRAVAQMVQRAIGFEYEVNRETYKAPGRLSAGERQGYPAMRPANAGPTLGKGNTLVDGLGGGLSAKTDLGGNWNDTNLEFEIDPVDETPAGRARLALALAQL